MQTEKFRSNFGAFLRPTVLNGSVGSKIRILGLELPNESSPWTIFHDGQKNAVLGPNGFVIIDVVQKNQNRMKTGMNSVVGLNFQRIFRDRFPVQKSCDFYFAGPGVDREWGAQIHKSQNEVPLGIGVWGKNLANYFSFWRIFRNSKICFVGREFRNFVVRINNI